jgi:hypothetical protein
VLFWALRILTGAPAIAEVLVLIADGFLDKCCFTLESDAIGEMGEMMLRLEVLTGDVGSPT